MPVQNITVSSLAPFIIYNGRWIFNDYVLEAAAANINPSLSVSFYGTAIYLQAIPPLENCSFVLDGAAVVRYNATGGTVLVQNQLAAAHHTLIVAGDFPLTSVVVTTGDGDSSVQGFDSRIENDHRNVTYSGYPSEPYVPTASGNSVTTLSSDCAGQCPPANANISFHGSEIALYSWLGSDPSTSGMNVSLSQQSGYNVSVDGGPPEHWPERGDLEFHQVVTDSVPAYANTLLYQRSGLAPGDHYVVLTLTSATSTIFFDYAVSRAYPENDQSPIASPSQPTSTPPVTNTAISSPTSAPSTARFTNVATIAGGVVGGVVLASILSAAMFQIIRRRYRQARLTFVGEDGLDVGSNTRPRRSEEDMPPPLYRRIFPSESGAPGDRAQAEREPPADAHTPVAGRITRKNPRAGASALDQAASRPSTGPANTALDGAHARAPIARAILDASMWAWKGVRPREQDNSVPVKTNLPPGDTGEK